jgi:hypothetical protein
MYSSILDASGKPYPAAGPNGLPGVFRQPPLQISGKLKIKRDFENVVALHDYGFFQNSDWLVSQMFGAAPVAQAMQLRSDALTGTKIQFIPGRNNDRGRSAARAMEEEDWKLIASAPARAQMHSNAVISGVQTAQKKWYVSPSSGRAIPKVLPYSNMWVQWDWGLYAYRIFTWEGGWRIVPSPSLMAPGETWTPPSLSKTLQADDPRLWIVSEPYGSFSFRDRQKLLTSLWEPFFGWALSNNDQNRVCEKQGRGQLALTGPSTTDKNRDALIANYMNVGAEGVFFEEQFYDQNHSSTEIPGYKLRPFEWSAQGWNIVSGTREANANAIFGLIAGHNTLGQTIGAAGAGGGAATGFKLSGAITVGDTLKEFAWAYPVMRDWAQENYGDPDCAPIPIYATDDPLANVAAAQTTQFLSAALDTLQRHGADTVELQRRFQMPIRLEAQAPGWKPEPPPAKGGLTSPPDEKEAA